jgi:O-antigen/teichoic acid export membrane protein
MGFVVIWKVWRWSAVAAAALIAPFLFLDLTFLAANLLKVLEGGWVPLALGVVAADALFELQLAFWRSELRLRPIALALLGRGVLRLAVMVLALDALGAGFAPAFGTLVALQLAVNVGIVLFGWRHERQMARAAAGAAPIAPATASLAAAAAFAAPLLLMALLAAVHAYADRFVLTQWLGLGPVAVYAASGTLVGVAGLAQAVLGFTLYPVLARDWNAGRRDDAARHIGEAIALVLFLVLPYLVCLACAADAALALVATADYRIGPFAMALLGAGAVGAALYQTLVYLLLLAGAGWVAAALMAAAALGNLALNAWLVPVFALAGAALAAALSNALLAAGAAWAVRRRVHWRFPWRRAGRSAVGSLLAGAALLAVLHGAALAPAPALALGAAAALLVYAAADLASRASLLRRAWRREAWAG